MSDETDRNNQQSTAALLTELEERLEELSRRFEERIATRGPQVINDRSLGDRDIIKFLDLLHKHITISGYWHPLVARKLGILGDLARLAKEDWCTGQKPDPDDPRWALCAPKTRQGS